MSKKVNVFDTPWTENSGPGTFQSKRKWLTGLTGLCGIGCSMYRLESGKKAFPAHSHASMDEAILVLKGSASLRLGDETMELNEGDYIALPAGTGEAHQMTGGPIGVEYLCFSKQTEIEVVTYPDSNKVGVVTLMPPAPIEHDGHIREFYRREPVGYYDGENGEDN